MYHYLHDLQSINKHLPQIASIQMKVSILHRC